MENLQKYFDLFDQSRTSEKAFEELSGLFTEDMMFVLNGHEKHGIDQWNQFVKMVFQENVDLKHMFEGWVYDEKEDLYVTPWAVCGKRKSGEVYTQTGKDFAKLDTSGKITYLANVPDNTDMFSDYKK
ncbi:nuclear transport factor 2 family protein [Rossellomorea marisflavi]|uniref:Nuclear transport factor 2 family protein n=1 Tax=Rossellomorea marisflavi TaxID=189381 RepID=A0A5D4S1J8_9BACI|nr:nuclear transport factor 2 family protein [Rossellomorea marisflavi]TYS56008.1 nuclear transport factor 2 family protein [Rossellomorea marisflavi]UKS67312.1 nuclear transport factor 2 family protein [Rossellomorea marisflavi]VXB06566.1 Polyketide cyclase [Bacillus sp. 349Y]